MKKLIGFWLMVAVAILPCEARRRWIPPQVSSSITYLLSQDMAGAGTPAGWTDSGTVDWNYATNPMVGSYSFRINLSAASADSRNDFTAQDEVWVFFVFRPNAWSNFCRIFYLQTSGFSDQVAIRNDGSSHWSVFNNSSESAVSTSTWSNGTVYYLWLHYVKGSGSNSVSELYVSTTTTKPGSPDCSLSNGSATGQVGKVRMGAADGGTVDVQYDMLRVSAQVIGSNPS